METNQYYGNDFEDRKRKLALELELNKHSPRYKDRYRNKSAAREHDRTIFFEMYRRRPVLCAECHGDKPLDIHHRDGDPFNNHWKNLEGLCRECHQERHHGDDG